jgi:hypothetical protein
MDKIDRQSIVDQLKATFPNDRHEISELAADYMAERVAVLHPIMGSWGSTILAATHDAFAYRQELLDAKN